MASKEDLLRRALALALEDLEVGGATGPECTLSREGGDQAAWMVYLWQGGQCTGFGVVVDGETFASLLATVADRLQDAYIDHLWEARPRCPLHEHPLRATEHDGEAIWSCPSVSDWTRPIGALATDREYRAAMERP